MSVDNKSRYEAHEPIIIYRHFYNYSELLSDVNRYHCLARKPSGATRR